MHRSKEERLVYKLNSASELIQRHQGGSPMQTMYYIGLDVHKGTISYSLKDGSGTIHAEGTIPATRFDLDRWMKTLPQPVECGDGSHSFCRMDLRRCADPLSPP